MQTLKIHQSVAFQSRVQRFSATQRLAAPLAPVAQKPRKPTSYKVIHIPKALAGITEPKVVRPPAQDHVDLLDRVQQRPFIAAAGLQPNFVLEPLDRILAGKHIQIMPAAAFQISIVTERKAQKVQRLPLVTHLYDVRLIPVQLQAQLTFQSLPDPVSNLWVDVSGQYHQIISIPDQTRVGHLVRPPRILVKGSIKSVKVNIGQQRRDDSLNPKDNFEFEQGIKHERGQIKC
jgi:hypothetical protein